MPSSAHYPLALGNTWTYKTNAGQSYTTTFMGDEHTLTEYELK